MQSGAKCAPPSTVLVMRFATWNCQGGLAKKVDVVRAIAPDVLLVQECQPGVDVGSGTSLWYPPYEGAAKGTGLFCSNGWSAEWLPRKGSAEWVMPARVRNELLAVEFTLLAVWTNKNNGDNRPGYAEQFSIVLDLYGEVLRSGQCVVAGDLNASIQGPSRQPHEENLARVAALGMVSAYHHAMGCGHGEESDMTLKWVGPGRKEYLYHCDFVFLPQGMAQGTECRVFNTFGWPRRVSDHQPVIVDGLSFM